MPNQKQDTPVFNVGKAESRKDTNRALPFHTTYDASGKLVAEYANQTATTTAQVSYLTSDHLGSPRINTDQNGTVISRHDYQPFGEEIYAISGNTARTGYSTDQVRKQFTGYEADMETELSFAQARYYSNNQGRFTSVDDFTKDSDVRDPQSWNKYAYVRNNPLNLIDPTGEKVRYIITVDTKNRKVSVRAEGSIGIFSSDNSIKPDLKTVATQIQNQINSRWQGSFRGTGADQGWSFNFTSAITVQAFDKANSVGDVMNDSSKGGNKMDNIVQLENYNAAGLSSYVHNQEDPNQGPDKALGGKKNPDGISPDVGYWDYPSVTKSEPAHEFTHIQGAANLGKPGVDLSQAPGPKVKVPSRMTSFDFDTVVGQQARYAKNDYLRQMKSSPTLPAVTTYPNFVKKCCK